ncbi:hypothetical protein CRE_14675 [Caenorhabditis remanei]|uniref:Uncharacterized protein n=1 Tax=Caenorhabditis remanei TaxID=31234 RepID=E3M9H5_CAERE|nr:hypothetical protein CRE_14675 [Caenorhabditis remanei]
MPHIAYSKKSFGIKNKTWLRTLCLFITATILVQDLTFGIEMYATAVRGCAITVFTAVYVLNPWIITYKRNSEFIHRTLQYSYIAHTLAVPLHLLASSVVIYILWRMSKVKPDYNGEEPYEVIYGGQDSETKKLLDSK